MIIVDLCDAEPSPLLSCTGEGHGGRRGHERLSRHLGEQAMAEDVVRAQTESPVLLQGQRGGYTVGLSYSIMVLHVCCYISKCNTFICHLLFTDVYQ